MKCIVPNLSARRCVKQAKPRCFLKLNYWFPLLRRCAIIPLCTRTVMEPHLERREKHFYVSCAINLIASQISMPPVGSKVEFGFPNRLAFVIPIRTVIVSFGLDTLHIWVLKDWILNPRNPSKLVKLFLGFNRTWIMVVFNFQTVDIVKGWLGDSWLGWGWVVPNSAWNLENNWVQF